MSDRVKNEDGGTGARERGNGKIGVAQKRKKVVPRTASFIICLQLRLNKCGIFQRMKHQYVLKFPKETRLDTGRNVDPCTV